MVQSKVQFDKPVLIKCEYFENDSNQTILSDIRLNIENKYKKDENKSVAIVVINVELGEKTNSCPFYINIVYSANFKWDSSIINPDDFLRINAPALLYSYVRPLISNMLSNTKFGRIDLPFMDFSTLGSKQNNN